MSKQMKSERDLSDTMEINVEMARKAVGSLFTEDDDKYEDKKASDLDGFGKEMMDWDDDDDDGPIFPGSSPRTMPIPAPKPAVKVNASVPAASRIPTRSERRQAMEAAETDEMPPMLSKPPMKEPKPQSIKKKYTFIDEEEKKREDDDEFASFRQKYLEREKKPEYFQEEGPIKAAKYGDQAADEGVYVESGLSAFVRGVITAFMVMLLIMMVFLVHRNVVLSGRLDEANERLLGIPYLENDLTRARIDLEAAREDLAAIEAENIRLTALVSPGHLAADVPGADEEAEGNEDGEAAGQDEADGEEGTTYTPAAPAAPAAPGGDRIHVVVAGDSLSRIASRLMGSASAENVQRIMDANNITDANEIFVGDELIIPN